LATAKDEPRTMAQCQVELVEAAEGSAAVLFDLEAEQKETPAPALPRRTRTRLLGPEEQARAKLKQAKDKHDRDIRALAIHLALHEGGGLWSQHYWEHGWVVVPEVFSLAEVGRIAAIADQVGQMELSDNPATPVTVDTSPVGRLFPRKIDWAFPKHEAFRSFVLDERLQQVITSIIGRRTYLVRDQIFLKPARFGSAKPWHQDQPHLQVDPLDDAIGAWIALDDAAEDNGCLRYIDGSHRGPAFTHTPMPGAAHNAIPDPDQARMVDWSRERCAIVPAGGVALHHPLTLHSSRPNASGRPRRAYSSHWVTESVGCTDLTLEWAYSSRVGKGRHPALAP
jgi:phytanoyl-CoA hydroxylase